MRSDFQTRRGQQLAKLQAVVFDYDYICLQFKKKMYIYVYIIHRLNISKMM